MGIFNYIELTKDVVKIFPNWNLVSTPVKIHWILDGFYGSEINILGDRSALGTFMNERTIIPPFSDATLDELEKYPRVHKPKLKGLELEFYSRERRQFFKVLELALQHQLSDFDTSICRLRDLFIGLTDGGLE